MSCGFDKGLLAAHYDGETTGDERAEVERHLASCPECARDLASMKDLSAALKPLARAVAPMSVAEGVLKEIAPVRPVSRPWAAWKLSVAATVLVAVGAFFILNRDRSTPNLNVVASEYKPAAKPLLRQEDAAAEREFRKSAIEPAKTPPADPPVAPQPLAEAPEGGARDEEAPAEGKSKEESTQQAHMAAKIAAPVVPVVRVKAADVAAVRGVVATFLAEREIKVVPGAPLLGRSAYVRDHYLQLDLTAEEAALLDKRIAEVKDATTVRTTLEVEKKRLAEDLAKLKPMNDALGGARPDDDASKDKAAELEEKADRTRRAAAAPADKEQKKQARPVRVIYFFEPVEPKR
ncbi:MAG TPA: zf-HC2 domain-containing protein [Planctomycetota bacterium]|nr:zf-HC2 domain-containing protein [Planctomycetota bacterium]